LGELEWVKTRIDKPDAPDGMVLLAQAEICERLKRNASAAALLDQVLSLVEEGALRLDADDKANEKKRSELERRLAKLDQKNAPLRAVKARTKELQKAALPLLSDYRRESGLELRTYTYAHLLATALADAGALAETAEELRTAVKQQGKLIGIVRASSTKPADWKPRSTRPHSFEIVEGGAKLACRGGTQARRDDSLVVQGECEWTCVVQGEGPVHPGSAIGLVLASHDAFGDLYLGLDEQGKPAAWTLKLTGNGGTSLRRDRAFQSSAVFERGKPHEWRARLHADGSVQVWIDGVDVARLPLSYPQGEPRSVGLFAKDSAVRTTRISLEIQP
jgi:hypothetical protein